MKTVPLVLTTLTLFIAVTALARSFRVVEAPSDDHRVAAAQREIAALRDRVEQLERQSKTQKLDRKRGSDAKTGIDSTANAADWTELERRVANLEQESATVTEADTKPADEPESIERTRKAIREIKREDASRWAVGRIEGAEKARPVVLERVRARMRLTRVQSNQLEEIFNAQSDRQAALLDRLLTEDPPASDIERGQIFGELKMSGHETDEQVRELLGDEAVDTIRVIQKEVAIEQAEAATEGDR